MCNLSNGWARRHGRGDVMTSIYKSTCSETGVNFLSFSKRSVRVLSIQSVVSLIWCCLSHKLHKMSKKHYKGASSAQYKQCVPLCKRYMTAGDTHSLCTVCLGAEHAQSALFQCTCFELDERELMSCDDITELRRTADLALRTTKETTRAIGLSMAALVAAE